MDERLEHREGLPEPLRVLLKEYPREAWVSTDTFSGLIKFWLDRHLMFRRLMSIMSTETEAVLDKSMDPQRFGANFSRYGGMFLQDLHMHHTIEDTQYFPKLKDLDARITRGFDILDKDHHAIDGHLATFADDANAALRALHKPGELPAKELDALRHRLTRLNGFLDRHLVDEEELVVPVLLAHPRPDIM